MGRNYHLTQTGDEVQTAIDKIIALNAVEYSEQSLTSEQKAQARENIGAVDSNALATKVDKVDGKGLSTNDYTDGDKEIVEAIPNELDVLGDAIDAKYTKPIEGIPASDLADGVIPDVSGKEDASNKVTALSAQSTDTQYPSAKVVYDQLATKQGVIDSSHKLDYSLLDNTPDLSGFITKSVNDLTNYYLKTETYTKGEVEGLIAAISQFHYEIYASTSAVTSPANNVLYLIGPTGSGADKYEEYVYPDSTTGWVKIGDTSIDLSGYVTTSALNTALANYTTTSDLTTLLEGKQDTINDLSDIRSGAGKGETAYQLPSTGIPESDLAQTVADKLNATEIFAVTYGTTTQSQIATALAAGKLPVCKYGDNVYVYAGESSAGYSQFTSVLYNTASRIYVKTATWGNGSLEIYSKPSGGIPASDIASGVIPTIESMTNSEIDSAVNTAWV